MSAAQIERKYALSRIAKGDYILPGNDGKRLYRIFRYMDGPSAGLQDWPRDRWVWGAYRWTHSLARWDRLLSDPSQLVSPLDWENWVEIAACCETRQRAIEAALTEGAEQ